MDGGLVRLPGRGGGDARPRIGGLLREAVVGPVVVAVFMAWAIGLLAGCSPDSGSGRPDGSHDASADHAAPPGPIAPLPPPPPPGEPPRVARPDAPDVAPVPDSRQASQEVSSESLRREPPASPASKRMSSDEEPAGVVSWEAKPDPPLAGFQREFVGRYPFPLDSGVEVFLPQVPSHFLLLVSRGGPHAFRDGPRSGCAVFDLRTGKPAAKIEDEEFRDSHGPVAFSPDGVYVVDSKFMRDGLRVWSFNERALCRTVARQSTQAPDIAFFLDNTRLLVASGRHEWQVEILSVETGDVQLTFSGLADRFGPSDSKSVAVSPGGNHLAVVEGQSLHVFDLKEGREIGLSNLAPFSGYGHLTWAGLAFRSDGGQVVAVGYSMDRFRIACWDMGTGNALIDHVAELPKGAGVSSRPESLAWLPDTDLLVFGGTELIDVGAGGPLGPLPGALPGTVLAVDNRRFLTMQSGSIHRPGAIALVTIPGEEELARRRRAQSSEGAGTVAGPKLSKANLSKAARRQVPTTPVPWTAAFAPCEVPEGLLTKPISAGKSGLTLRSMAFNKSTPPTVALVYGTPQAGTSPAPRLPSLHGKQAPAAPSPACWIDAFNLATGTRETRISLPGFYDVLALSMDGTLAVLGLEEEAESRSSQWFARHPGPSGRSRIVPEKGYERLDIWSLQTGNHALGFRPYAGESQPEDREVTWCGFLDKRHALTTNRTGLLVKWEFPSCRAEYAVEGFGHVTAMSPDRRYVIGWMPETDVFRVVDTQSGDCQGELHIGEPIQAVDAAAISACGRRFATIVHAGSCRLIAWELGGGTVAKDVVFSWEICGRQPSLAWVDPSYVMVSGRYLLDLERSTTAWQYTLDQGIVAADSCDNRLWYLVPGSGGEGYRLGVAAVPDDNVRAQTANLELADQVTFRPGVPVSLSVQVAVSGVGDAAQILSDAIHEQGVPTEPSAELMLEYRANEKSTGKQTEYRPLHGSRHDQSGNVTVNEKAIEVTVRLVYRDGVELWKTEHQMREYTSMMVHGDPQATYDEGLRRHFAASLRSFRLPVYVFLPPEKLGAGSSHLDRP